MGIKKAVGSLYFFLRSPFGNIHKALDYNRVSELNAQLKDDNIRLELDLARSKGAMDALDAENRNLLNALGMALLQNRTYRKKFDKYQDKVRNSAELKRAKVEIDGLRRENSKLEDKIQGFREKISGFNVIYRQQQSVIKGLHERVEMSYKELRGEVESILEQLAEGDKEGSWIIIGGPGRIVASTPAFRDNFKYNSPEDPIKGKMFFRVLRPPKNVPEYSDPGVYVHDIRQAFRDLKESSPFETTITDGEGKDKIVLFKRHTPVHIKIIKTDSSGQELAVRDYFYTKVDIYEIGRWEKIERGFKKILHIKDGEPERFWEFAQKRAVQIIQDREREKKEHNKRMAQVYCDLVSYDSTKWNTDVFLKLEKQMGREHAGVYLRNELLKAKREMILGIIGGVLNYKLKEQESK